MRPGVREEWAELMRDWAGRRRFRYGPLLGQALRGTSVLKGSATHRSNTTRDAGRFHLQVANIERRTARPPSVPCLHGRNVV